MRVFFVHIDAFSRKLHHKYESIFIKQRRKHSLQKLTSCQNVKHALYKGLTIANHTRLTIDTAQLQ